VDALGILGGTFRLWLDGGGRYGEQLPSLGNVVGALAVGEKAVVTDASRSSSHSRAAAP
jgi:hypothetical protein